MGFTDLHPRISSAEELRFQAKTFDNYPCFGPSARKISGFQSCIKICGASGELSHLGAVIAIGVIHLARLRFIGRVDLAAVVQEMLKPVVVTGFKVVEGRSNRKYTDEDAAAKAVSDAGYSPYEQKLLGITAMSQMLGKKKFEELLSGLFYKPPGKPALVPESDKRPAMNTAINDFKEN